VIPRVFRVLLVLWCGSLWSVNWVTWTLFHAQSDRQLAGMLAGKLFTIETSVGLAVAALALCLPGRARYRWVYLAAALLAINQWALRPLMGLARSRGTMAGLTFGAWHGVSMVLYLIACVALIVLWACPARDPV
jgi:hypothetical protein